MDYLYSLYDALVSVNVRNDKAKAVVDAMERDMSTTIATKADLGLAKADLQHEIQLVRHDIKLVKQELTAEIHEEVHSTTIRLGALIVIVAGLLATLKLI